MRRQMLWLVLTVLLFAAPLVAQDRLLLIEQGKKFFFEQGCFGCHTVGKMGTRLAQISRTLAQSIRHPILPSGCGILRAKNQKPICRKSRSATTKHAP
jgi:hypothetical protein